MRALVADAGEGAVFSTGPMEETIEALKAASARAAEHLPVNVPERWRLVCSASLLDEYLRKIVEVGPLLDRDALGAGIGYWRHFLLQVITDYISEPFKDLPRHVEADDDDDHVVETALRTESAWLISDDSHIVPDADDAKIYETGGDEEAEGFHRVIASRFDYFHEAQIAAEGLDLDEIDTSWALSAAYWIREAESSAGE